MKITDDSPRSSPPSTGPTPISAHLPQNRLEMRVILATTGEVFTSAGSETFTPRTAMPADLRFMKRPHQTWFFVYAIPRDLRGKLLSSTCGAKDKIVESLGTKDPDIARERRNKRLVHWDRQFRRLRHGPSEDDIIEEAV